MGTVPWPRYSVQAGPKGGPEVRYSSAIPSRIEGEAQRLRDMGLEEGKHFTVNSSRRGERCIYIRMGGLIRAARLSVLANSRSWRRSSWSASSKGLGRQAGRFTKKPKKS